VTGQLDWRERQACKALGGFLARRDGAENVAQVVFAAGDGQRGVGKEGMQSDGEDRLFVCV
jgi:hypothetical protein